MSESSLCEEKKCLTRALGRTVKKKEKKERVNVECWERGWQNKVATS